MRSITHHQRRRTSARIVSVGVATVAGVVWMGACGADESGVDATTTTAGATRAAYIVEGDVILCAKSDEVAVAASALPQQPTDAELRSLVLEGVLPAVQRAHDALGALTVPEGDEETVALLLSSMQQAIDRVAGDPATMFGVVDPFADVDDLIGEFGLTGCPR